MVGEAFGSRHDVDVGRLEVRIAEHHLVSVFPPDTTLTIIASPSTTVWRLPDSGHH